MALTRKVRYIGETGIAAGSRVKIIKGYLYGCTGKAVPPTLYSTAPGRRGFIGVMLSEYHHAGFRTANVSATDVEVIE